MRNLFLFHMMLPTWMPFLSKILSTLNPFCLTHCPWNRWWQMFCQPLVSFVQVLEKTLWTFKTLLTETFCMQSARLPCETKAPPNELVPCFLGYKTIFRLLTFSLGSGDMEPILDHLLGPIIDRFPKLFFWAIYQGQWLEQIKHILLRAVCTCYERTR